ARLAQIENGATGDDLTPMPDEVFEDFLEIQQARLAIDQRHHVDAEGDLQRGLLEQVVQHHVGRGVTAHFDHHAHAILVGLVAQAADALEFLLLDQLGDFFDQPCLVDLIRNFGGDDRFVAVFIGLDFGLRADQYPAATGAIRLHDACRAIDDAGGREVRSWHVLHQVVDGEIRVVDQRHRRVDHLAHVVWGHVGGHADGNAGGTVDQQVRNAGRQDQWLLLAFVVVGAEVDRFLVDVGQQLVREARHAHFGVTHRRRAVTIHRAEVALPVHQHVAQREGLRHAHYRVVHRRVAVRVVFADHVTDHARGFLVRLVPGVAQFVHREQHAAMHRLQAIAHVRKRAAHDHAHRVIEVALAHLVFNIDANYFTGRLRHSLVSLFSRTEKARVRNAARAWKSTLRLYHSRL